jgi:hypothetical protein
MCRLRRRPSTKQDKESNRQVDQRYEPLYLPIGAVCRLQVDHHRYVDQLGSPLRLTQQRIGRVGPDAAGIDLALQRSELGRWDIIDRCEHIAGSHTRPVRRRVGRNQVSPEAPVGLCPASPICCGIVAALLHQVRNCQPKGGQSKHREHDCQQPSLSAALHGEYRLSLKTVANHWPNTQSL